METGHVFILKSIHMAVMDSQGSLVHLVDHHIRVIIRRPFRTVHASTADVWPYFTCNKLVDIFHTSYEVLAADSKVAERRWRSAH